MSKWTLRQIEWICFVQFLFDLRKHASQDLQLEVFLVMQAVAASLDKTDLIVQSRDELEQDFVARIAVVDESIPVLLDHLGESFLGVEEALPFQPRPPVLEEFPRLRLAAIIPNLPEELLQQIGGVELFVRREQSLDVLGFRAPEVVRMGTQGLVLVLAERAALDAEPGAFLFGHLVARRSEMIQDVELDEQDRPLWGAPSGRGGERLPHVYHQKVYPAGLLVPERLVELVRAPLEAIFLGETGRLLPMQVDDRKAIDMPLAERKLADPQRKGTGLGGALELHAPVAHLQALDRLAIENHLPGNVLDFTDVAAVTYATRKALGAQRILQHELQSVALHLPAPTAFDPPPFQVQVNPVRTAGQIMNPSPGIVVPASINRATCGADRFFSRRTKATIRTCGSPNKPCTVALVRNPGNVYPSTRRRVLGAFGLPARFIGC